jgi:hypothetical protein
MLTEFNIQETSVILDQNSELETRKEINSEVSNNEDFILVDQMQTSNMLMSI